MSITKARATPYNKTSKDVRAKQMTVFSESIVAEPKNNVRKLDSRDSSSVSSLNFDVNNDDQLITWANDQIKDPDYRWRGIKIDKIDTRNNQVVYHDKGQLKTIVLKQFLDALRQDLTFELNKGKLSGQSTTREEVENLINQDIQNGRPYKGKKILYIDHQKNQVVLEGDNIFGLDDTIPLDKFINDYMENRKFGYKDSDTVVQASEEETRKNNIADMAEAFRQALGIKAPRIESYAPLKDSRQIGMLATELMGREMDHTWTAEELVSVYKTGNIPNMTAKVSGERNNIFVPQSIEPKLVRTAPGPAGLQYYTEM